MDQFLRSQNAIVTGGTRGIGLAIAKALASAGANVGICGRSEESMTEALPMLQQQSTGKIVGTVADVSDASQVAGFFRLLDSEIGKPNILINNAGIGKFAPVGSMSLEDWRTTIDTNLSGVFYCSREALTRFSPQQGGFIINIGSLAGRNAFQGGAAYNASKFGLNGFTEAMMLDHRADHVRVSCIMPGSVDTSFGSVSESHSDWKITPEDIADIVMMLLRMPKRTLVSRVEVRPSNPRK